MIRFASLLIVLLLSACAQPPAIQQPLRPDQLDFPALQFNFPEVQKQQLQNGGKVYLKQDHELPLVELTLMIAGGSIRDPLEKTGLSELFVEALETGGTASLSPAELESELEKMAAELSVSSSAYNYQIDLSLHKRDLQRGLQILAELLRRPAFDPERIELARSGLLESIRRKNDDPDSVSGRLLAEAVYPGHPFGASPQRDIVEQITRDDLIALHQTYFRPDNLWLAVSGDFEAEELLTLLEQGLAGWVAEGDLELLVPELPAAPAGQVLLADKDIPQTSIMMGHPGINKDNPDQFALRVANYILGGGGFNSRMMREVRSNRGLAYSVYSYFQIGRQLPELFVASSETKTESTVEVVTLMRQLMQQIIDEPVEAKELTLAQQSLINSFVFAFTDSHSVVSRQLRLDFFHYPADYMQTYQDNIAAVTIADVQRVAREYLRPNQLQIVLVGDTAEFSDEVKSLGLPVAKIDLTTDL